MSSFETITEYFDNRGATLAVEEGVIRGVKILGLESKNGRTYSKEAVARALTLYEGAKVNVDHPTGDPGQARSYGSRMGVIENARMGAGDSGLFGDFRYNPKHALAEQLQWDAEHAPENVGFSHNVMAKITRRGKQAVVEEITKVQSVDLVADPATTRGLFEATEETDANIKGADMSETTLTLEGLKADCPSLVEQIAKDAVEAFKSSAEQAARDTALKEARERLEGYELGEKFAENTAAVKELIEAAKLPAIAVTDDFLGRLMEADAEGRTAMIADRQTLVEAMAKANGSGAGKPTSKEQRTTEGQEGSMPAPKDEKETARLLKAK